MGTPCGAYGILALPGSEPWLIGLFNQSMDEKPNDRLRIEFVKSSHFRVIHPDGAFGGTTPRLQLFIDFYTERFPIPKVLVF
jgi:hypothetical protein